MATAPVLETQDYVVADIGLADFGRPDNFLGRQVDRWRSQLAGYGEFADWTGPQALPSVDAIAAWLERHKEYPQQARARRQEGVVLLRFTIDRAGRLLNWRIDQGSGYAALDREVEAMLRRATPLPPLPPEMTQAELELAVPIRFRLR